MSSIRGELKLQVFGQEFLTSRLIQGITSLSIVMFIDDFELYCNMYHSLTGIYVVTAELSMSDRQKSINAHIITLEPHGSDFNDVIKALYTSMGALDCGCPLEINGGVQYI